MHLHRLLLPPLLLLTAVPVLADYADDTGFTKLQTALGPAMLTGAGIGVSQVEADVVAGAAFDYLPQAGAGTFAGAGTWAGKTFTAKAQGGAAGSFSFHAAEIGLHIYGLNTVPANHPNNWASMAPGILNVDVWMADTWDDDFLSPLATNHGAPVVEVRKVQNHAWVSDASNAGEAAAFVDLLRRQDFAIERDKYLCVTAVNNYATNPVPDLMASAYNPICAGLTNAAHSRHGVTSDMDGAGRRKPEIVVPVGATSYAAGYLSSAASLLFQKAASLSANAADPRTVKAALLAGATKEEFPGWAKTSSDPIDDIFGAGELNIFNSHQILTGGEQTPNLATGSAHAAWDHLALATTGTADYRLNIPAGRYGLELSAFAVWHRQPVDAPSDGFSLNNPVLANYNLTLFRDPAAGGNAVPIDISTSTLYNIEHVRARNLPAGNYRLRLSRASDSATGTHSCAIAWRLDTAPHEPVPAMTRSGSTLNFTFNSLLTGQPYKFQSSTNLTGWVDESSFTGGGVIPSVTRPAASRGYFRLLPVLP